MENRDEYLILSPDGREMDPAVALALPEDDPFRIMTVKEALGQPHPTASEPEYLRILARFGIGWERMSDNGHMRYAPPGALIFDLLSDYALAAVRALPLPIMTVRGTNMFDLSEPAVAQHAALFGERLYRIGDTQSGREFVLRYAACHQQFAMVRDWGISYRQLPFGVFEVADSYRLEQSGECMLGFRTRRLNMPDLHVFCLDEAEAWEWLGALHRHIMDDVQKAGRDYEMLINFPDRGTYERVKPLVRRLLFYRNRPALLHFYPQGRGFYWTINIEYHIADVLGHAREIANVQMDVGNAARFGIEYTDSQGARKNPVILHTAITGSIERHLYLLVDGAAQRMREGRPGELPFWLNPEQVRILTVSESQIPQAEKVVAALAAAGLRAGLDDRSESLSRKVRQSREDWVGAYMVYGAAEVTGAEFRVQWRGEEAPVVMSLQDLICRAEAATWGKPARPLTFPPNMSRRPAFC